ncbi:hypothetical protein ACJMK2_036652 [Sinanodonta woodiana]|uniref:Uncharacterized protein n=1 Tax=Sinanodonta woodiana TaxID=1069815 RepID=A0ABD3WLF5_SINWO
MQKRWRQKQNVKNNDRYLKRERMRKKGAYIPTYQLTPQQQEKRRKKCREDYKRLYIRKKKNKQTVENPPQNSIHN